MQNLTISKDVKALKLISPNNSIRYYKVRLILRKRWEIVDKDCITKEDINSTKILSDMLSTVSILPPTSTQNRDNVNGKVDKSMKDPVVIYVHIEALEFMLLCSG